ncbi:MAG TPA: hypothetical protein IAA56_01415 [Candidatus Galloscillospira excrementavium]|nr:hypothetical protein [Candidatus Galloscillospira excrementavium]
MAAWWESLTLFEQICLYIAVPATLILLIQLVMLLAGLGGGGDAATDGADADGGDWDAGLDGDLDAGGADLDGNGLPDSVDMDDLHDGAGDGSAEVHQGIFSGLNILTVRGVVAFLTLFGWSGLWLSQLGLHPLLAAFLAIQIGVIGMVGVALILRSALRLQYDGTLDLRNAVGLAGTVYLTVPARRGGCGKVNVLVQEQLREFEAVTEEAEPIPTGEKVLVTGLAGEDTLLVSRAPAEETHGQ